MYRYSQMESDADIESQFDIREVQLTSDKSPASSRCCCVTAYSAIGKLANIIRMILCIGLCISGIVIVIIASGSLVDALVSSKILYVVFAVVLVGGIMLAFDGSTAQWLVQKVLSELTADVARLEGDLTRLEVDIKLFEEQLKESRLQIQQRDEQIVKSEEQIVKSEAQLRQRDEQIVKSDEQIAQLSTQILKHESVIVDLKAVQANMGALVTSLVAANQDGADLNVLFSEHLSKFQQQLTRMEKLETMHETAIFENLDIDNNNLIDQNEFHIYLSSKGHPDGE